MRCIYIYVYLYIYKNLKILYAHEGNHMRACRAPHSMLLNVADCCIHGTCACVGVCVHIRTTGTAHLIRGQPKHIADACMCVCVCGHRASNQEATRRYRSCIIWQRWCHQKSPISSTSLTISAAANRSILFPIMFWLMVSVCEDLLVGAHAPYLLV